jgi:Skp family chaperone for outer membrane proteins
MISIRMKVFATLVALLGYTIAFVPCQARAGRESSIISMGIIDDLKLIFSEEGKKNRAEFERRQREEMAEAQRDILERRRNPEKMKEYEQEREKKRQELAEERKVYDFQNKVEKGYDPLADWKRLREEGKLKIGDDLQRDESSSRLGSEGLIDVRVDERMP